jgi:NCS2 family nucleobase:cation symporter-2
MSVTPLHATAQAVESAEPVDQRLPGVRLATLGLQHVLVMYAGAVAVPLIVGRALGLTPEQVALLISADLFCCGLVSIIQSLGATRYFGIRLPVMMGVTFAALGPMLGVAAQHPGLEGARYIFGATIASGLFGVVIAPMASRLLRFFPPVVTGSVIAVIGISLMRVGINWIFGLPVGPTAPRLVDPVHAQWLQAASAAASAPQGLALVPTVPNPSYATLGGMGISALVMVAILLVSKFGKGFLSNISVLIGIVVGAVVCAAMGTMHFEKVAHAAWVAPVMPFQFGVPIFDAGMILTMCVVMIVTMIESTGMFLALGEITGRKVTTPMLTRGLRTDGLGTLLGGVFNTFPYTSFSQNVGLVGVTGVRSRYVCVAGGLLLIGLGLVPKLAALVEALPSAVLGGAGLVMFGMVAATGIRILSAVDFKANRHNQMIVALSIGFGMIPLAAPEFHQWLPRSLHSLIDSGIILTSVVAVLLNLYFNGLGKSNLRDAVEASKSFDSH